MLQIKHISPAKIELPADTEEVRRFLTFVDRQVQFQIKKIKDNIRWKRGDPNSFEKTIERLKEQQKRCIVFYDRDNRVWTYSGLWQDLRQRFGWTYNNMVFDDSKTRMIEWNNIPPEMRYYQKEAVEELIKSRHGAIELPTGSGKSRIILELCKTYPVKTLIMTPFSAITDQLYRDFKHYFGPKYVGKYGDGKKNTDKLFTIATAQALTIIEPGTEEWENLSKIQMFIADECHTTPAKTFEAVCMGVAENAPLRFFVSATLLRMDGSELVLKGITGPVVYKKKFKELVNEGFLKKPIVKIFKVPAYGMNVNNSDVKIETRNQLYENPNVNKLAASIAVKSISLANRQTVIIIEEFKQFMQLKNYLPVDFEFVHGGANSETKKFLPEKYWKSDIEGAVKRFNNGETKLLIGTSAISTGVDLKPVGCLIYLQGGVSEIKVRQAIGRGTRITDNLKDLWVIDFLVDGSDSMRRHLFIRKDIYDDISDEVKIYG